MNLLSGLSAHCSMVGCFGCVRVAFWCTLPSMVIWKNRDPCKVQLFNERLPMHLFTSALLAHLDVEGVFLCRTVVVRKNCKNVIVVALHTWSKWTALLYVFIKKKRSILWSLLLYFFLSWRNGCRSCWWFRENVPIQLDWGIAHHEAGYFRKSLKRYWLLTQIKCEWKVTLIRHSFDLSPSTCIFLHIVTCSWPKVVKHKLRHPVGQK